MDKIQNALNAAYSSQVRDVYTVFSRNLIRAQEDATEIAEAKNKFKAGLLHIQRTYRSALEVATEITAEEIVLPEARYLPDILEGLNFLECPNCGGKVDLKTGKCPCNM